MLPNGYTVPITRIGSVKLTPDLALENVLYVPHFNFNLLSVSIFTHSLHCSFNFFPYHCFIQEHSQDQMIVMGRRQGNLYLMELGNFSSSLPVVKVVCNSVNLFRNEIWHYRLGHPSYVKLQVLSKDWHISGDLTTSHHCSIFHLAKQRCLSFVSHNSFSDSTFQLIHYDIWGAFHVATWVYLLRSKSDVTTVLPTLFFLWSKLNFEFQ